MVQKELSESRPEQEKQIISDPIYKVKNINIVFIVCMSTMLNVSLVQFGQNPAEECCVHTYPTRYSSNILTKFKIVITSFLINRAFYNLTDMLNGQWELSEFDI